MRSLKVLSLFSRFVSSAEESESPEILSENYGSEHFALVCESHEKRLTRICALNSLALVDNIRTKYPNNWRIRYQVSDLMLKFKLLEAPSERMR